MAAPVAYGNSQAGGRIREYFSSCMIVNFFPSCSPKLPQYSNLTGLIWDCLQRKIRGWCLIPASCIRGNSHKGASVTWSQTKWYLQIQYHLFGDVRFLSHQLMPREVLGGEEARRHLLGSIQLAGNAATCWQNLGLAGFLHEDIRLPLFHLESNYVVLHESHFTFLLYSGS